MGWLRVGNKAGFPSCRFALSLMLLLLFGLVSAQNLTLEQGGIIRGPGDRKQLALVFTADSWAEGIEYVLSELNQRKLKGSFFLTGNFLRRTEFRLWIEKMIEDGHYLGPHSDRHLLYCDWQDRQKTLVTREEFLADLENNFLELEKFGVRRDWARYFIPPYEWYNREIAGWAEEAGVTVVNFTPGLVTSSDYTTPDLPNYRSSEEILNQLLARETEAGLNGFIILIHPGVAAERTDLFYFRLGELIEELIARGYTPVRIDELLSADRSEQGKDIRQTVISQARVEPPDKSEKIKPSGLEAQVTISGRTAEKSSNSEALTVRGKGNEASPITEEGVKFSLTRAWINFARGQISNLVTSGHSLFWFFENNPQAYELIEVKTGKKLTSDLLERGFEQNPVPARSGFWLSFGRKVLKLGSSGMVMGPQLELAQPLAGAPVESGNWLLLPFKKSIEARSAEALELLWKQELPAGFSGPLIISGSEVLVPCVSGQLLRFQLENGQRIDQPDLMEEMEMVWLVNGQKIFFSPVRGKVRCYDLSRRKIRWEIDLGSQRIQYLISDVHNLYLLTSGGIIYKLKQSNGDILWWQTIPGRICSRPAIFKDELIVPSGQILYGLDLRTGRKISETVLTFEIKTDLITAGDLLLASTYDYRQDLSLVYALKKEPRVIIRPSRESPQPVGQKIIFTAVTPGLENPSYEFYLRTPDGRDLPVRKASRNNTWTWLPLVPGEYLVSVIATSGSLRKKAELRYNISSRVGE